MAVDPKANDNALVLLVVADVLRRQGPDATTDDLVRVAVETEARAATALRLKRDGK